MLIEDYLADILRNHRDEMFACDQLIQLPSSFRTPLKYSAIVDRIHQCKYSKTQVERYNTAKRYFDAWQQVDVDSLLFRKLVMYVVCWCGFHQHYDTAVIGSRAVFEVLAQQNDLVPVPQDHMALSTTSP